METKNIMEVFAALKEMALLYKAVAKDGKVDMADLPQLMVLVQKQQLLIDAVEGLDQIPLEVRDLSIDEVVALVQSIASAVKEIKAA